MRRPDGEDMARISGHAKTPTRLGCARRRLGFDRNELRRRIDRVQWMLGLALLTVFLVVAPIAAFWIAHWSYDSGMQVERRESAGRRQVIATVAGPGGIEGSNRYLHQTVHASWPAPDGTTRSGQIPAWKNVKPGARQRVWVDQAGRLSVRPRPHSRTLVDTGYATAGSVLAAGLPLLTAYLLVRRRCDRRRDALWDDEWARIDPHRIS